MSLTVNLSAFGTIWGLLGALFIGGMIRTQTAAGRLLCHFRETPAH